MSKEEREQAKDDNLTQECSRATRAQMGCDARWTVITMPGKTDKEGKKKPVAIKPVHGYKNHVSIDNGQAQFPLNM